MASALAEQSLRKRLRSEVDDCCLERSTKLRTSSIFHTVQCAVVDEPCGGAAAGENSFVISNLHSSASFSRCYSVTENARFNVDPSLDVASSEAAELRVPTSELEVGDGGGAADSELAATGASVNGGKHAFSFKKKPMLLGVFDGHGGDRCSKFVAKHIIESLEGSAETLASPLQALERAFLETEKRWMEHALEEECLQEGSTAAVVLLSGAWLYLAIVGDSMAVIGRNNGTEAFVPIAGHRPSSPGEALRLRSRHPRAKVSSDGHRLEHPVWNGDLVNLGLSRSFGDALFKHEKFITPEVAADGGSGIVCQPSLWGHQLTSNDDFMILACDGLWDSVEPAAAVDVVRQVWASGLPPMAACHSLAALVRSSGTPGKMDDRTIMVVYFNHPTVLNQASLGRLEV